MAATTFVVNDCLAARCDFSLDECLHFILGQRFSGYFYRCSEEFGVLRAGVIEYCEQAAQGVDRGFVASFHCHEKICRKAGAQASVPHQPAGEWRVLSVEPCVRMDPMNSSIPTQACDGRRPSGRCRGDLLQWNGTVALH
jgi:hypothetical protein